MQTIFEKKEPTWVHDITEATESASTRVARKALRLPTVVAFAVSTCIVGAAGNAAPMQIESVDATSTTTYSRAHPSLKKLSTEHGILPWMFCANSEKTQMMS